MAGVKGIKLVAFDAYGTLFDVHSAARRLAPKLDGKAQALSDKWRQKQLEYTWLRSLMGAHADFWQVTGEALDFAMEANELDNADLRDALMALYLNLDCYPEVPEVLRAIKAKGLKTAILSNGAPRMLEAAVTSASLGEHLDALLSIESAGIFKPSPKTYQLACDRFAVKPGEVAFLSSNGWDIAGAAFFGLNAIWVNRFEQPVERLPSGPAFTLASLGPLPDLLSP